jgi:hypothetical protein
MIIVKTSSDSGTKWVDTRFLYRKNFTIPITHIYDNLTNFPLLLDIFDSDLKNNTSFEDPHLLFTNKYGQILPYEIELFDPEYNETHCHLITWVKTNLTIQDNNILWMYYGIDSREVQDNRGLVWSDQYQGVWHLSENSGTRYDSTNNNLDLNPQNYDNDEVTVGIIGMANELDGLDDYLETYRTPNETKLGGKANKTVSMWVLTREFNYGGLVEFGQLATRRFFSLYTQNFINGWKADWWGASDTFNAPSLSTWVHLVITYNNGSLEIYANGELVANSTQLLNIGDKITLKFGIALNQSFSGTIDEIRISPNTLSQGWIKTEYMNQNNPSGFYLCGSQESDVTSPTINHFGIDNQTNRSINFYADLEDDYTAVKDVTLKINNSVYQMYQNLSGLWVYNFSSISYGNHFVYQILNASDFFGNSLDEPTEQREYTYLIDNDIPIVKALYFTVDNEEKPTNLTFISEIEEYGSGIDNVTLYYSFEEIKDNQTGTGASVNQFSSLIWSNVSMKQENVSEGIYLFSKTIPFSQNETNWKILYQIDIIDKCGNTNNKTLPFNPETASQALIIYDFKAPLVNPIITNELSEYIVVIITISSLILLFSGFYVKFVRKNQQFSVNSKALVQKSKHVSEKHIRKVIDDHTTGVVLSYFDQHKGPTPILSVPISLENESSTLMKLAVQSFSTCHFTHNYEKLSHAIFNYQYENSHKTINLKSFSYTFVIVRPEARGGVENLCISVLATEKVARMMLHFQDILEERVKRVQSLLDKDTEDQLTILNEMNEFRKMISQLFLTYKKIYR